MFGTIVCNQYGVGIRLTADDLRYDTTYKIYEIMAWKSLVTFPTSTTWMQYDKKICETSL